MGNQCQCGEPATRLIRTYDRAKLEAGEDYAQVFSMDRPTTFACCEPHRHSAMGIIKRAWAKELREGTVRVRMGRKRRPGV